MTGYLERLVDRHAVVPAVRPRAVSRFEGDLVGPDVGSEPAAPVAEAAPVADGAAVPAAPRATESAATAIAAGSAVAPFASTAAAARSDGLPARDRIDTPPPLHAVARPTPSPATPAPSPQLSVGPSDQARHDEPARTRGPAGSRVAPVTIRRADPASIAVPTGRHATATRRSVALAPPEPDVVHVHIGRVEVRATVPAREPSRPAPRPSRPTALSLDRYLSGERRT